MNRSQLKECRKMLLDRLDILSIELKSEVDSLKADEMLVEMRAIGNELLNLTNNPVPDHLYKANPIFKEAGRNA